MVRVYCAGPLSNPGERAEMDSIASTLELSGFFQLFFRIATGYGLLRSSLR